MPLTWTELKLPPLNLWNYPAWVVPSIETQEKDMNDYERICKEWLKGCSCSNNKLKPEQCEPCTEAFMEAVKNLAIAEGYGIGSSTIEIGKQDDN